MSSFTPAEAFQLFVTAYAHLECAVLPGSRLEQCGGLSVLHFLGLDGNLTREALVWGLTPSEALEQLAAALPGQKHWLTLMTGDSEIDLPVYLSAGYQHRDTEALLVRDLERIVLPLLDARVLRATRVQELAEMNALRGYQVYHPDQLDDPLMRIYRLEENGRTAAWGSSLMVQPECVYLANMYTLPECRRKGLARAVFIRMLADAAAAGARRGLLVSSQAGLALYRSFEFQPLLECLVLASP